MKFKFTVKNLDCPNCAAKLSAMIEGEEGIDSAKINFLTEKVTVESGLDEDAVFAVVTAKAAQFSKSVVIEK